ncbi:hypothetical protein HMPREF9997_01582 [Corynebacterium durum F0235]|uniref:Uncharacterized protein n=1 Tax=Corynebacterium durum F0235 TaxID=1035195 RepID=L1MGL9_9CORY|nr:hypothetical protein HMPREF9997_01582 [Corynebacterium durum F0235]
MVSTYFYYFSIILHNLSGKIMNETPAYDYIHPTQNRTRNHPRTVSAGASLRRR